MRGIAEIRKVNQKLAAEIESQGGFINGEQIVSLASAFPDTLVLIRCSNGRMLVPARNVEHFTGIICGHFASLEATFRRDNPGADGLTAMMYALTNGGDYIRDYSLPV